MKYVGKVELLTRYFEATRASTYSSEWTATIGDIGQSMIVQQDPRGFNAGFINSYNNG